MHYPDLCDGNGLNYTGTAFSALQRLPFELREMLKERGAWPDVIAWAFVAAVEGHCSGWDFRETYNAAQRYIYVALKAEGFRRESRKRGGSAMMYIRREVPFTKTRREGRGVLTKED